MTRLWPIGLLVVMLLSGCSSKEPGPTSGAPAAVGVVGATGSADLHYSNQTVVWKQDVGRKAVKAAALSNSVFLLDATAARDLTPGKILLIEGTLARKIVVAEPFEDGIAVLTEPVGLGEIIQDGTLHLEYPVRFGAMAAVARHRVIDPWSFFRMPALDAKEPARESFVNKAPAGAPFTWGEMDGEEGDWKTKFSATPEANKLSFTFELKKQIDGGFSVTVSGDGYLADFDVLTDIMVERTAVEKFEVLAKRLNGTVNLRWLATQEGTGPISEEDRFKLPGAIQIPLAQYVGGFPLFMEISAAFLIKPAFSAKNELSRGSFRVTYDGMQRFRIKGGNIDSDGNITGDIKILEHANLSPMAPMGMLVAFAAPRIELTTSLSRYPGLEGLDKVAWVAGKLAAWGYEKLTGQAVSRDAEKMVERSLKSEATAYIEAVSSVGSIHSGMLAIVPCQKAEVTLEVKVGAGAELFGMRKAGAEKDIFHGTKLKKDPENVKCAE